MNTPSPFIPQGAINHASSKSRVRMCVFTILAAHLVLLGILLIQGCKRETAKTADGTEAQTNSTDLAFTPLSNTNAIASSDPINSTTGFGATSQTGSAVNQGFATNVGTEPGFVTGSAVSTGSTATTTSTPTPTDTPMRDYVVVKGDTLGSIARKHNLTLSALRKANPSIDPMKLKLGQKLQVPAGATTVAMTSSNGAKPTAAVLNEAAGSGSYVVKQGDSLTRIAKAHGTTVPALKKLNNMKVEQIKVGQKIKVPVNGSRSTTPAEPITSPTYVTPVSKTVSTAATNLR